MTTREGILPYWNGQPDLVPRAQASGIARLKQLAEIPREVVIDDRLFHRIRPQANQVICSDLPNGGPLVTLTRPDEAFFDGQLAAMTAFADLRPDRLDEIEAQAEDITGVFASALGLETIRSEWILELMEAVVRLCGYVEFPLKFHFDVRRPAHRTTRVMPVIETPGHGSWPSGHGTEAFALATVLAGLLHRQANAAAVFSMHAVSDVPSKPAHLLKRIAMRIADNRVVAGVHFPYDSVAGAVLGTAIGEALVNYVTGASATPTYTLAAPALGQDDDLTLDTLSARLGPAAATNVAFAAGTRDALLQELWAEAVSEMVARA